MTSDDTPDVPEMLPTNLSPLQTCATSWVDERGTHLAFWDRGFLDPKLRMGYSPLEFLEEAVFIVTLSGIAAMCLAEGLLNCTGAIVRHGLSMSSDHLQAPAPFPADARERIYRKLHGLEENSGDLSVESIFTQVNDILRGNGNGEGSL